jgi:protein-disulfide isomerase
MPSLARRPLFAALFAFVVAWMSACLAGCGAPPGPPRAVDPLVIGRDDGGAALAAVSDPAREDDAAVPVAIDDAVRGPRDALITIVVWSDFQCPFCGRLVDTLERVQKAYGDDLRIVFKNMPLVFHDKARLAAEVGQGVLALKGNEAFWRYHDMAFRRQGLLSPDSVRAWAIAAGVDARDLEAGLTRGTWAAKIDRDMEVGKRLDANGTPTAFVNGVLLSGAQPFEKFQELIDGELKKAKEFAARGVSRDRVYALRAASNFVAPKDKAQRRDDGDEDDKPDLAVWKVPVGGSPVRGSAAALVTLVEFSDFQCPYCKRVEATLERVRKEYGDRLRVVWKDEPLPFHPRAVPAAQLARAARAQKGDAGFWAAHDKLFESQPKLEDADLEAIAVELKLDVAKARAAFQSKAPLKAIEDDASLGDDVQASGTPHFFVNGRRLVGAQPFEKFKAVIDEELTRAEALVRSGAAKPSTVYDVLIKDGKSAPEPERKSVATTGSAPFRGAANAKVVIQQFSDFQCPFCARVEPTVDEVLKAYPGKVKVVWRNLPLVMHADAPLSAEAAREAFVQKGNDGFSRYRELLFKHQRDQDGLKRAALEGYAAEIGLDARRFGKALDDRTHQAAVEADATAANAGGLTGTPAFLVGPYYLSGAQPLAKFKKLIERVLVEPAQPAAAVATPPSPGGLIIKDEQVGAGAAVKSGDKVSVHYVGRLTDGTEFDSSRKHGAPFDVEVGQGRVIKGWDQGLVGMKAGGRRKLTIPPELAYGTRGVDGAIPPGATLVFDIELLSVQPR